MQLIENSTVANLLLTHFRDFCVCWMISMTFVWTYPARGNCSKDWVQNAEHRDWYPRRWCKNCRLEAASVSFPRAMVAVWKIKKYQTTWRLVEEIGPKKVFVFQFSIGPTRFVSQQFFFHLILFVLWKFEENNSGKKTWLDFSYRPTTCNPDFFPPPSSFSPSPSFLFQNLVLRKWNFTLLKAEKNKETKANHNCPFCNLFNRFTLPPYNKLNWPIKGWNS